tara:strand:- start:148 stop:405 length:258 start_codon:yes stop_codon:yes gene_type:complete
MSKKYIYSEKKVIKEFLGSLLSKMIVNRNSKIVQSLIKNDPLIAKYDKEINKIGSEISARIERKRKNNPNYDKEIAKVDKYLDSL